MAVGQPSLHSLQRFSEKEVPEEMRGEEISSLGGRGLIVTLTESTQAQIVVF
jgi:hypothetical protein